MQTVFFTSRNPGYPLAENLEDVTLCEKPDKAPAKQEKLHFGWQGGQGKLVRKKFLEIMFASS
jgi:hypothetical protein